MRWTLASDESGAFDRGESHACLVGGVLLPHAAEQSLELKQTLSELCARENIEYPPHSTELRQQGKADLVDDLLAVSADWLERNRGFFIGLLRKAEPQTIDAALHARMLGAFIDLSARIASSQGATELDLRPASRTFHLERKQANLARKAGLHVEGRDEKQLFHGVLGTEAREALDALARSPEGRMPAWPKVHSVEVATANWRGAHPGVLASDLFCNRVYGATRQRASSTIRHLTEQTPAWKSRSILIVDYTLLDLVGDVDRALRQEPPRLHELGVALSKLERARRGFRERGSAFLLGIEGALHVAELLAERGQNRLLGLCERDARLAWAMLQRLAGDAQGELDLKHGDYDGTARALRLGFSGDGPLASALRSISDRELVARLHRLSLECCNHVGDLEGDQRARDGFAAAFAQGASLALLGEALKVENLTNVALQNRLPCTPEESPQLFAALAASATQLHELAKRLTEPLLSLPQPVERDLQALSEDERALRELGEFSRGFVRSDREYGRCLGTAARTLAFTGELDGARALALEARCYFEDSPFDLAFNAAVLARVELERARIAPDTLKAPLLALLLKLADAEPLREMHAAESAIRSDPSRRFALDLLLRQLLWAPQCSASPADSAFINLLALGTQSGLYQVLAALPSHPTELIARHVAELLRQRKHKPKVVQSWFELSPELAQRSTTPTLQRIAMFTRQLASGHAAEGPNGSILNPSFEYR